MAAKPKADSRIKNSLKKQTFEKSPDELRREQIRKDYITTTYPTRIKNLKTDRERLLKELKDTEDKISEYSADLERIQKEIAEGGNNAITKATGEQSSRSKTR